MDTRTKTRFIRWASALTCILMLAGALPVSAAEAPASKASATISPDIVVKVDGEIQTFLAADGTQIHPVIYNDTIYLPLSAIGELTGKTVSWDATTHTVSLSSSDPNRNLVTDAGSFGEVPGTAQTSPQTNAPGSSTAPYIGEETAKSIALNHAGLTESQVTFIGAKLDFDDGRWEYDVEFYTASYQEYDYEIDALTGTILEFDYDIEDWSVPSQNTGASQIGIDKAKTIAVNHAGLGGSQVTFVKAESDYDDGRWEYEIEFVSGNWEYECEIDAYSGAVLDYERESIYD